MKANHNTLIDADEFEIVVVNISSSKNESKSQPPALWEFLTSGCCKYQ